MRGFRPAHFFVDVITVAYLPGKKCVSVLKFHGLRVNNFWVLKNDLVLFGDYLAVIPFWGSGLYNAPLCRGNNCCVLRTTGFVGGLPCGDPVLGERFVKCAAGRRLVFFMGPTF